MTNPKPSLIYKVRHGLSVLIAPPSSVRPKEDKATAKKNKQNKKTRKPMSNGTWWSIALVVTAAVIGLSAWALLTIPNIIVNGIFDDLNGQIIDQSAKVRASVGAHQAVTLAIGGIIAIFTFVLSLAKHRLATQEQTIEKAKHERENEKHQQDRDSAWSNRYAEAIAQFSDSTSHSIRLGGLYSLERTAKESDNDRQPILEVLCAFLRENRQSKRYKKFVSDNKMPADSVDSKLSKISSEVVEVVARIIKMSPPSRVDLEGVDLAGVNLRNANFMGAQLDFADLSHASLANVYLQNASLINATFDNADMTCADLSGAQLKYAHFISAQMAETKFIGAKAEEAIFDKATMPRAKFNNANLNKANFPSVKLNQANFTSSILNGAILSHADLTDATFKDAAMDGTHLDNAFILIPRKLEEPVKKCEVSAEDFKGAANYKPFTKSDTPKKN